MVTFKLTIGEKVHLIDGSASIMLVGFIHGGDGVIVNIFRHKKLVEKNCNVQWGDELRFGDDPLDFFRPVKQFTVVMAGCSVCSHDDVYTDTALRNKAALPTHNSPPAKRSVVHYKKREGNR